MGLLNLTDGIFFSQNKPLFQELPLDYLGCHIKYINKSVSKYVSPKISEVAVIKVYMRKSKSGGKEVITLTPIDIFIKLLAAMMHKENK